MQPEADPFAIVRPFDVGPLADLAELAADFDQPWGQWDDGASIDPLKNPEIDLAATIAGDHALVRRPTRRLFVDWRSDPEAYAHLARLPAAGESLHGVISGKYALWDLVPALIERTGQGLAELYIATLGFSRANAAAMLDLVDEGRIRRMTILVSHYFLHASRNIYDATVPELLKRDGVRVLTMRSHCKLLLARTRRRTAYVCEASANLRSSKNVEQFVLTRCPRLYRFHQGWIERELLEPRGLGRARPDAEPEGQPARAAPGPGRRGAGRVGPRL